VENAPHGAPQVLGPALTPQKDPKIWTSRLVDYEGVTAQALRDLTAWAEDGVAPPADTSYRLSPDGAIKLEQAPLTRGGVQPVASATANGGARADVNVGDAVRFVGVGAAPAHVGVIVAAEWDFTGRGDFKPQTIEPSKASVKVEAAFVYDKPGTYFACFRVSSNRKANGTSPHARNNARVRVVVKG
jgi:hypothetical protein